MAESGAAGGYIRLPLAFFDTPSGPVIRCECGAETELVRRSTGNPHMIGLRGSGMSMTRMSPDVGPAAILAAISHARNHHTAKDR